MQNIIKTQKRLGAGKSILLGLFLLSSGIVCAQKVEEVVLELPHLVIDRATDSADVLADRKRMLVSSSASIVETDSAHRFIHIGVPQPSKKVLQVRILNNAKGETLAAVSQYAANLDCDDYRFTIYQKTTTGWIDVTQQSMPMIYFFQCIRDNDPVPSTKICFDMNSDWYYNLRPDRITAEPVAKKNIICMEQMVKDIATKEGKPALDSAMQYYYAAINNRPYKKLFLQWQSSKSAFEIIEKR